MPGIVDDSFATSRQLIASPPGRAPVSTLQSTTPGARRPSSQASASKDEWRVLHAAPVVSMLFTPARGAAAARVRNLLSNNEESRKHVSFARNLRA